MRIVWIAYKRVERELDWTTWIDMTKEMLKMEHWVNLVIPYTGKIRDSALRENITYLPSLPWRVACTFSFSVSLFFYLIFSIFYCNPHIILMDSFALFPSLPFLILSKLGWIKTKFVLDVRTLPVETYTLRGWAKKQIHITAFYLSKFLADGVTAISPFMKKYISHKYNISEDKIGIWSSGVSLSLFNPNNVKPVERFNSLQNKFIVMYHGAFSQDKGPQLVIKATELLKSKYPDILLILVGGGSATDRLRSLIKARYLEDNVYMYDSVPHERMPSYISVCNAGVISPPSSIERRVSSPLKLMEYLAMEKPVIVTDIEAHREVLNNADCGIFIQSSSPEDIADGIIKAYKMKDKLKEIGKEGREIVKRNYTWEKQAKALISFLNLV